MAAGAGDFLVLDGHHEDVVVGFEGFDLEVVAFVDLVDEVFEAEVDAGELDFGAVAGVGCRDFQAVAVVGFRVGRLFRRLRRVLGVFR